MNNYTNLSHFNLTGTKKISLENFFVQAESYLIKVRGVLNCCIKDKSAKKW